MKIDSFFNFNFKSSVRKIYAPIFVTVICFFFLLVGTISQAQTTLAAGDIAFIGVNTDKNGSTIGYGFSVVFLKDVSSGTTLSITDNGWIDASSSFRSESGDATLIWTATRDVSAGEILHVKTTAVNGSTISPIPSIGSISATAFVISGIGDQIFIYQGPSSNPTFITGIHWNLEPTSTELNWDDGATVNLYNTTSDLPDQLTNGVNAIWVYNTAGTTPALKERDDFRYKSTALTTGSPTELCTAINTLINWDVDLTGSTPFLLDPFPCTFTVTTGNFAPTASSFTASPIYQNTAFAFATANFGYSDFDSDPLDHIRVTAVPGTGILWVDADASGTVNGTETALLNNATVTKANLDAGYLKYLNTSGTSSSFTFDVNDGTDYSTSTYTATLNVTPEPTVTLSLDPSSSISENGGTTNIKATLSHTFNTTVTIYLAFTGSANGSDYSVTASTISIASGNTNNTASITGQDDTLDENNETVIVDISSVANGSESGTQQVTCTLTDDDDPSTVTFTTASQSSIDETGTMTIMAQLSTASGKDVTVPFFVNGSSSAIGGGTDYSITSSPLIITAGNTSADITITIATDALDEDNETVIVDMGTPTNATQGAITSHTATITDDDAAAFPSIAFNATKSNGLESVSSAILQVNLSAISTLDVTVSYAITGTATGNGTDYTLANGTLTITAGNTTANITITSIIDDAEVEGDETVIVTLLNPGNATLGANTVHTYTITDNDNATNISDNSISNLSVYPNPFTNTIHLDNTIGSISHIIINDLSGQTVLLTDYKEEKNIDVSHLIPGIYLLIIVNSNGERQIVKIVKE